MSFSTLNPNAVEFVPQYLLDQANIENKKKANPKPIPDTTMHISNFANNPNKIKLTKRVQYSANYRLSDTIKDKKMIICGFESQNDDDSMYGIGINDQTKDLMEFYEIQETKDNNQQIEIIPMSKLYGKKNSNLNVIGIDTSREAFNIHLFITGDNKYIIVINVNPTFGYNVYDIENDIWLLHKQDNKSIRCYGVSAMLLINDELLMMSHNSEVEFYNLSNIKNPVLIKRIPHDHKVHQAFYSMHGMFLLDYKEECIEKFKNNINNVEKCYFISLLLFGGYQTTFKDSILKMDVRIDRKYSRIVSSKQSIIDKKMNYLNDDLKIKGLYDYWQFQNETIQSNQLRHLQDDDDYDEYNDDCISLDRIILLLGGICNREDKGFPLPQKTLLYNVNKHEIMEIKVVKYNIICQLLCTVFSMTYNNCLVLISYYTYTILHNNIILQYNTTHYNYNYEQKTILSITQTLPVTHKKPNIGYVALSYLPISDVTKDQLKEYVVALSKCDIIKTLSIPLDILPVIVSFFKGKVYVISF